MKPLSHLLILLCMLPAGSTMGQSNDFHGFPFITNYSTSDYGAGIQNWGIAQDRRGIIFIANNYGLLEFDGTNWEMHRVSNRTKVRSVAIDAHGRIYVGAQNEFGYFYPDATGTLAYHSLSNLLPVEERNFDEVWRTYVTGNDVFFCSFRNIYRYDGKRIHVESPGTPIEFTFLCNGTLYVQESGLGLATLKGGQFKLIEGSDFLGTSRIADIVPYNKSAIMVATVNDGVYLYDGSSFRPWGSPISENLKKASISNVCPLDDGTLLIGTSNDGLYVTELDGSFLNHFSKGRGIINRTILATFQDDQGNVWLGLNNGLAKIELSSPFTLINEQMGVQGTGYTSYIKDNTLYLGTNNGLFSWRMNQDPGYVDRQYTLVPNMAGQVYGISEFYDRLYIGHHGGVWLIEDGEASRLSGPNDGVWGFRAVPGDPQHLLTGTYSGFSLLQHKNTGVKFTRQLQNFAESSRVFEEDNDGHIWMSHGYKGVFRLQLSEDLSTFRTIDFFNSDHGFPSNLLINVFKMNNSLVFASERGIYSYQKDSNRFVRDPVFTDALGENVHIREMEEDAYGNIYLIGSQYTGVLKKDAFNTYSLETRHFNKIHNLLNDDLENIAALDPENVLFGAKEGFIHYNPQRATPYGGEFQTLLRKVVLSASADSVIFGGSFTSDGAVVNFQKATSQVELPYRHNSLRLEYAAVFFDSPGSIQYSYRLDPFDEQWSGWSHKTEKEYTNLREGNYTFQVKSRNIYDIESNIATYRFGILAPWYRTKWAYLSYFLLCVLIIGVIIQTQRVLHQKEKRIMTISQKRKLIQKDHELEKVSKKSEEEIVKLRTEKLASEINHKNKELATTTMNLINKNKLLTDIKDSLKHFTKENGSGRTSRQLGNIIKKIDQNMGRDDEWEHFMQYFDQVHGDFSTRLRNEFPQLSPQDLKLCAYLRMNLSTKEIAQLLNITIRGVEIARYRLRKKLVLDRTVNLAEYILNF